MAIVKCTKYDTMFCIYFGTLGDFMIKYDKLFSLLEKNGIKKSSLRDKGFSPNFINKLEKGGNINSLNIEKLCILLSCQPGDLMEYVPDKEIN